MSIELIINADDFGLSSGINRGIIGLHRAGIVTSTSMMINIITPAEVELLRDEPALGVGIHVNITRGKPMSDADLGNLLDERGEFHIPHHTDFADVDEEHIRIEVNAQVEAALDTGLNNIDHIDTHHHAQRHTRVFGVIKDIAAKKGLACRASDEWMVGELRDAGVKCNDFFIEDFHGADNIGVENLVSILDGLKDGVTELMCHPGYKSDDLKTRTGYFMERPKELHTLGDPAVRDVIERMSIQLINFG